MEWFYHIRLCCLQGCENAGHLCWYPIYLEKNRKTVQLRFLYNEWNYDTFVRILGWKLSIIINCNLAEYFNTKATCKRFNGKKKPPMPIIFGESFLLIRYIFII